MKEHHGFIPLNRPRPDKAQPPLSAEPVGAEPETLDTETIERLGRDGQSALLVVKSLELAERAGAGVERVPEMIRTALERLPVPDSAAASVLRIFFVLHAKGELEVARRVFEVVEQHSDLFRGIGDEDEEEVLLSAMDWAEELHDLPPTFPLELRTLIAEGLVAGDVESTRDAMRAYVTRMPHLAAQAAEQLHATPSLFWQYHRVLTGTKPEGRPADPLSWVLPILGLLILWLGFQAIRRGDASHARPSDDRHGFSIAETDSTSSAESLFGKAILAQARTSLALHCTASFHEPAEPICTLASEYLAAVGSRSCAEAQKKRLMLRRLNLTRLEKPLFDERAFDVLWNAYDTVCEARSVAGDPGSL